MRGVHTGVHRHVHERHGPGGHGTGGGGSGDGEDGAMVMGIGVAVEQRVTGGCCDGVDDRPVSALGDVDDALEHGW